MYLECFCGLVWKREACLCCIRTLLFLIHTDECGSGVENVWLIRDSTSTPHKSLVPVILETKNTNRVQLSCVCEVGVYLSCLLSPVGVGLSLFFSLQRAMTCGFFLYEPNLPFRPTHQSAGAWSLQAPQLSQILRNLRKSHSFRSP